MVQGKAAHDRKLWRGQLGINGCKQDRVSDSEWRQFKALYTWSYNKKKMILCTLI